MDKGIRQGVNAKFKSLLAERSVIGNKAFRKQIIFWAVEQYGCTVAAACTHYNYAFQECKKANPELVEGLGRPPEKNNGGRKKKEVAVAVDAVVGTLISQGIKAHTSIHTVGTNPVDDGLTPDTGEEQTVFKVCKKSSGDVIAEGLSFQDAKALVEKAAAAKKAKLYWV